MDIKKYLIIGLGIFVLALSVLAKAPVRAQSQIPLQVSPPRQEIVLNPGEEGVIDLRFYNLGEAPLTGILRVSDFVVESNDGTPRIIEDPSQISPRFSGSQWITLPYDRMSIAANDRVQIQARFTVPADARPGGRYVAVFFEPSARFGNPVVTDQPDPAAIVTPRIAGLIYIKVQGPTTEKALISKLYSPSMLEYGPIQLDAEITNRGDYHIRPIGTVTVQNMLGGYVDQASLDEVNIFPDAAREYSLDLGRKWMLGRYTITMSASYGENGQALQRSISVWILPWKLIIAVLVALILLIKGVRSGYSKLILRSNRLEQELEAEQEEVERLKEELHRKK